jgi:hypothetical protein
MTSPSSLDAYREVWYVDFEFSAPPGERPTPICVVARELRSGHTHWLWEDELWSRSEPPYPTDAGSLFVAYFAAAELTCHLALGWPMPERLLDLYVEFRLLTNGLQLYAGRSLLGALSWYDLPAMEAVEKESMRRLAMRGGPWSDFERTALLPTAGPT